MEGEGLLLDDVRYKYLFVPAIVFDECGGVVAVVRIAVGVRVEGVRV